MPEVNPHFLKSVAANLTYWIKVVSTLQEQAYIQLDLERENLQQGMAFGLSHPATWETAVQLQMVLMDYLESRGLWRAWTPWLEQALENCPADQPQWRGKLACRLGFFYRLDGQLAPALALHQQAYQIAKETGERGEEGWAASGIADEYYQQHNFVQAEMFTRAAIQAFQEGQVKGVRLRAAFNLLGMIAYQQGRYAEAEQAYRAALAEEHGDDRVRKRVQVLLNLTGALWKDGRVGEAQRVLAQISALVPQITSPLLLSDVQNTAGLIYFAEQNWDAAEVAFRAMDTAYLQRFGHLSLLATQANNLGNVYLKKHAYPSAVESLAYAAEVFQQLGDEINLANTLGDLGESCLALGQPEKALLYWEEAMRLLEKYPQNDWARKRLEQIQTFFVQNRSKVSDSRES